MSTLAPTSAETAHRAIEKLILTYAVLVDEGDFAGVAELFAHATYTGTEPVSGRDAIERSFRETLIVYEDGTPRTRHVTTNIIIEIDEDAGTATSRAYFTALQALPDLPLQPIAAGRYHDSFERRDGQWRFTERRVHPDFLGDVSRHLRGAAAEL